jgi:hypothetical protein
MVMGILQKGISNKLCLPGVDYSEGIGRSILLFVMYSNYFIKFVTPDTARYGI